MPTAVIGALGETDADPSKSKRTPGSIANLTQDASACPVLK